jgi:hypothetical protein
MDTETHGRSSAMGEQEVSSDQVDEAAASSGEARREAAACCGGSAGEGEFLTGRCPMASMCAGMAEKMKTGLGFLPFLLGALFVALGVCVVVEPLVLIWLAAILLGLLGVSIIGMAYFMRRMFTRPPT